MNKKDWALVRRNWQLYLIFLFPLAWFVIFRYWPLLGIQIAFKDYLVGNTIFNAKWVGFDNFIKFFNHPYFWTLIRNTMSITVYQLIASFPIPIIFALALNSTHRIWMKKPVQYITYMPYFISTVVMVGIMLQFLNPRFGIINNIIDIFHGERINFMGESKLFTSVYVWSGVWQYFGWNSIIYLAVLSGISPELHEAAKIDGANRFKRVMYIDIPGIMPTMIVLLIMNCGQIMTVGFEKIFLMQNSLNLSVSQVISTYVYTVGIKQLPSEFSYGTAIDLFNSVINLIIIVTVNKISQKVSETSLW